MVGGGIRNHLPLLRTLTVLLGFLVLIGWGLGSAGKNDETSGLKSDRWLWAPARSFHDSSPPRGVWLPYPNKSPNLETSGPYWLQIPLDKSSAREPQLLIFNAVALSVYDKQRLLYTYDPQAEHHRLNLFYHWNLVPIPAPIPSEVYVLLDNRDSSRPLPSIHFVGKGDIYSYFIQKDTYAFLLAGLFLFSLFVALALYFVRRDRLHLYFALLAFCGCYASIARNYLLQVIWDQPWVSFMEHVIFPLGVYGFVNIMIEVFGSAHAGILRTIRWVLLGFVIVTLFSAIFLDMKWFGWLLSYPLLTVFLVTAGVVFHSIWSAYQERQGPESIWMLAGFFIVCTFALIHVLRTYLPMFYALLERNVPLLFKLPFDVLSVSLFLFLICLFRIIIFRFGLINKQLKAFNVSLESNVRKRTEELLERETQLRDANIQLTITMRGTAEAIASSMVLEERHLLTGTIHDTIGHSLTATIVQLEAAKRLLKRDPNLALEKLNASQSLVRRGLEEIRNSVRLLRDDSSSYDLQSALKALIRETEQTTGVTIVSGISPLPDSLTTLQKRVLYQALQEGMTNGLKHGGSTCFDFSLTVSETRLHFRLISDGLTYTPSAFGFGLKAMSERVANLGGHMAVEPGNPGCVLTLTLPFQPHAQSGEVNRG